MTLIFLYGTLRHDALRKIVLGEDAPAHKALLPGHGVFHAGQAAFPMIAEASGAAQGLAVEASKAAVARMDYYEGAFGYDRRPALIEVDGERRDAEIYWPQTPPERGAAWSLEGWAATLGDLATETAHEAMWGFGRLSPADLAANFTMMMRRADSRLRRRASPGPVTRRSDLGRDDVNVEDSNRWLSFFAFEENRLRHRRFDGSMSDTVTRAGLHGCDAAIVLPYDPVRDRVLLVEQFRYAPFLMGDPRPWCLEPPAGLVDPGEAPEDAARRELAEEAGVTAQRLEPVARCYPSPGALAEYQHIFVGITDLPDRAEGFGGLAEEYEDIRIHILPFAELERLIETGEAAVGPLILAAMWLKLHRDRLRSA
ncbi:NUDIX domain-containing protein [Anianabacter salinae]|uniref:NUDIX domain-containing protein n=1 Tax=Anianabacter salinae TaxID=2851023 RepID=UPI00225DF5AC|nr:NUDIX domain-containing protein [Anianabacter salinae]MBV0912202.1 NUDIX domain-containing protein [Anianabacter salinae]